MGSRPGKCLLVARGSDAGSRFVVDDHVKLVGRARDAHFVLNDRSVSRHHFHVHATDAGVYIRLCTGAAPLKRDDGGEIIAAEVKVGDSIVAGNTVFRVMNAEQADGAAPRAHGSMTTTSIRSLTGAAADVLGLAAVFALNEALTAAETISAIESGLTSWANEHAACEAVEVVPAGSDPPVSDETMLQETPTPEGGTKLFVPAHGAPTGWLAFTTKLPPERVTDSLRRLFILAGALYASRVARLVVEDDREAFRRQAVGSARAFLGTSPAALELTRAIPRLAVAESTALLLGETGVGKSFVARLIHESGPRKDEPFRVINCASIPENLVESELFGHERGAFTGAVTVQQGAFEAAGRGTVLLDEVGELPLASQAKLLHVLEDRRFARIGSRRSLPLHARILAATNRDLQAMVAAGTFRSDLFFRIWVLRATVPPLRERGDDLVLLAKQILADLAPNTGRRIEGFSADAIDAIRGYPWPGNVRELRNAIDRAVVLGEGPQISPSDLSLLTIAPAEHSAKDDPFVVRLPANLEWLEQRAIEAALHQTGGNRSKAAALLGINRNTLSNKRRDGA